MAPRMAATNPTPAAAAGPALPLATRRTLGGHLEVLGGVLSALMPPWYLWFILISTTGVFTFLAFKWWPWRLRFIGIGAAAVAAVGEHVVSGGAGFRLSTMLFASCAAMAGTAPRVPIPEGGWVCPLSGSRPSKESEASKDFDTPGHPFFSAFTIAFMVGFVEFFFGAFWHIMLFLFHR